MNARSQRQNSGALPAKGGGYVSLWLCLADGAAQTVLISEGYDAAVAAEYGALGRQLAAALNVGFREEPRGVDA